MVIRAVVPPAEEPMRSLAQRVRRLQDDGPVVLATASRPWSAAKSVFEAEGVDLARLFVLDAISSVSGTALGPREPNVMVLQSPTMLEMIAMRVEQAANRLGAHHVVLDNLNALALYNGVGPVQEFGHYLANRLRTLEIGGDLLILDNEQGQELRAAVQGFVDEEAVA